MNFSPLNKKYGIVAKIIFQISKQEYFIYQKLFAFCARRGKINAAKIISNVLRN
jgi:hypothetical protein